MARIRSIHPSLCTDEVFMGLSLPAKAAWPLLWMECDDQGVFEWKPVVLKARLFPADAIDMAAILSELETAGALQRLEIEGKPCGLIRNFCKYQRPKKPVYRHTLTDEMRTFVGLKLASSEPVPNQSPTKPELPPQRKEEGGKRKDEIKDTRKAAKAALPANDDFKIFWSKYPKRKGANPRAPAEKLFLSAVSKGADPKKMIAAIEAGTGYDRDKAGTEYIPRATTWLNERRWEDYLDGTEADTARRAQVFLRDDDARYSRWCEYLGKDVPSVNGGWWFDSEEPPSANRPAEDTEAA